MNGQLISLQEWDEKRFSQPHSLSTLRRWARVGMIQPAPIMVGRQYAVDPNAVYVQAGAEASLAKRLRNMSENSDVEQEDLDSVVMEIMNGSSS